MGRVLANPPVLEINSITRMKRLLNICSVVEYSSVIV